MQDVHSCMPALCKICKANGPLHMEWCHDYWKDYDSPLDRGNEQMDLLVLPMKYFCRQLKNVTNSIASPLFQVFQLCPKSSNKYKFQGMIYWQNGRERESCDNFQAEPVNPFLHQTLSNWLSFFLSSAQSNYGLWSLRPLGLTRGKRLCIQKVCHLS